jgi:hypothetical protein
MFTSSFYDSFIHSSICTMTIADAAMIGYLLIVSHLNARNAEGLSWADDILAVGLRDGDKISNWRIEVHSSDPDDEQDDDANNDDDNSDEGKEYGPAVYIVQKISVTDDIAKARENDEDSSKVDLKFFGY